MPARRFISILSAALVAWPADVAVAQEADERTDAYPRIAVRIGDRDVYARRDPVVVSFRTSGEGFVTVFRVDTDGRVRVLFPADPGDPNFVAADREHRVPNPYGYRVEHAFAIDDYPGIGYVFAVVSLDPFDYGPMVRNGHWEYRALGSAGRITGDPYVAMSEIVELTLPAGYGAYSFDVVPYYVGARYEYPRFVCYDCHAYHAYPVWDPYRHWCGTFKVVIYDRPLWYPATLYPATQRVVRGGVGLGPQFVIEGRTQTEPHVVYATAVDRRQPNGDGVRGRDLGGVGSVPAPTEADERGGGIGGFIRRLFGDSDEATTRRPTAPDVTTPDPPERQPQLERRKKGEEPPAASGRRPSPDPDPRRQPAGTVRGTEPERRQPAAKPERREPGATPRQGASGDRRGSPPDVRRPLR
jgi:hypothetical protein